MPSSLVDSPDGPECGDSPPDFSLGEEEAGALWQAEQEGSSTQGRECAQHDVHTPGRDGDLT